MAVILGCENRNMFLRCFAILSLCICCHLSFAQKTKPSSVQFSNQDSINAIKELLADLSFLFDSLPQKPKSFGTINVGAGLGYFTLKNSSPLNPPFNNWYYSTSGYYTHKSGLGISLKGVMMDDGQSLNLFQTVVSPSYDYLRSKNWVLGASYTHYFIKDSLPFETSPLRNEVYGYIGYKKSFLRPTIGINYAIGKSIENMPATSTTPPITSTTSISDVAVIASVQHFWLKDNLLTRNDYITFGPTLMVVAGTSKYGTNLSIGTLGKSIKSTNANFNGNGNAHGKSKAVKKKKKKDPPATGGTPTTEYFESKTGFNAQGATLIMGASYGIKKWFFQPQVMVDYTLPRASKQFNMLFNATVGVNF